MSEWGLLASLGTDDRQRLLARCTRRRFQAGAFLFHAGEAGDTLHLIDKGLVAVLVGGALGEPTMINILGAGATVGELALVSSEQRRSATVQAVQTTETLVLTRGDFAELKRAHPPVNDFLVAVLAERVRRLTEMIEELNEVSPSTRIYRRVVQLAELFDIAQNGHAIPITQPQLASLASTKLRLTNKVLAEARDANLLKTAKGAVTVLDLDGVRIRAGLMRRER